MKILVSAHHPFELWNAPVWVSERLRHDFPGHHVVQTASYDELPAEIPDAEFVITWSIRPEQFARAGRLRWVHSPAAAVHQLMFPELISSDVIVTNARDVHGPVVAEHALAVLLACAKRLPSAFRAQQEHRWAQSDIFKEQPTTREVAGSTVCVIGMGSIGREFATRARALGMRVLAVREHPSRGAETADAVFSQKELVSVLAQSDYVLLAAPLTESTRHVINAQTLSAMKPDAYLINVSRGPLIDDDALIAALRRQQVAGAALDVFAAEPLPADSPYWDLPNVLITPHTAAVTTKLWDRHYQLIADNLRRYLAGQPLRFVVDKQKGY